MFYCANGQSVLEDESGRVALASAADWPDALPVQALSTGLVVAVAGVLDDKGTFGVEAYCAPGPAPYPILPTSPSAMATTECGKRHVLLVSGFDVGGCADPLPASMLCDFVSGNLGGPEVMNNDDALGSQKVCSDASIHTTRISMRYLIAFNTYDPLSHTC